jgi:hypothetical protein
MNMADRQKETSTLNYYQTRRGCSEVAADELHFKQSLDTALF